MVTQDTINRINELYRKSKAEGLTSAEAEGTEAASCRVRCSIPQQFKRDARFH